MSIAINNNVSSLNNQRQLNKKTSKLGQNFERLASGKRINRAKDDAAGLAIALQLEESARVSVAATRNISDGVSAATIAEGAMDSASSITIRMSELAQQASNGTLSDDQRAALNNEYQSLQSELDRISTTTEFNGQQLLSGNSIDIQAGTDGTGNSQINLTTPEVSASGLGLTTDLLTQEGAQQALEQSKDATAELASARSEVGAVVSRLETAYDNLKVSTVNELEAASRIQDADVAKEAAGLTANKIGQQIGVSLAAQANQQPALALKLLS